MPESSCGEIIDYSYYSVSFCEDYKISEWSIHLLTKERLLADRVPRTNNFRKDPNLNGRDASIENYKYSGYDRGHLVPAGDMAFSQVAIRESFFMTNIVPQNPAFNRGALNALESKFREWSLTFDSIIVITGCINNIGAEIHSPMISHSAYIGADSVFVPYFQYKVFIDIQNKRSIAFLLPNEKSIKKPLEEILHNNTISIDYLESITGLDFFYKLPDNIEMLFEMDTGNNEIKGKK
jgi:endonuclease G, mitochondrial